MLRTLVWVWSSRGCIRTKRGGIEMEKDVKIEVKEMPELNVAYVQHIGPYKGDTKLFAGLFEKLMGWAGGIEWKVGDVATCL